MELLYTGSGIRVFHRHVEGSPLIAVVWSAWQQRERLWEHETASCSALFIVPDDDLWYQTLDLEAFRSAVTPVVAAYERRISIGSSMGGFAAIAFAEVVHATQIVAVCPQFSADPTVVGFEERWSADRLRIASHPYKITATDIECHLIYDPHSEPDARHAALIREQCGNSFAWPFADSGHPATFAIADLGWMRWMFDLILGPKRPAATLLAPLKDEYDRHGVEQSVTAIKNRFARSSTDEVFHLLKTLNPHRIKGMDKHWNVAHWVAANHLVAITEAQTAEIAELRGMVSQLSTAASRRDDSNVRPARRRWAWREWLTKYPWMTPQLR